MSTIYHTEGQFFFQNHTMLQAAIAVLRSAGILRHDGDTPSPSTDIQLMQYDDPTPHHLNPVDWEENTITLSFGLYSGVEGWVPELRDVAIRCEARFYTEETPMMCVMSKQGDITLSGLVDIERAAGRLSAQERAAFLPPQSDDDDQDDDSRDTLIDAVFSRALKTALQQLDVYVQRPLYIVDEQELGGHDSPYTLYMGNTPILSALDGVDRYSLYQVAYGIICAQSATPPEPEVFALPVFTPSEQDMGLGKNEEYDNQDLTDALHRRIGNHLPQVLFLPNKTIDTV